LLTRRNYRLPAIRQYFETTAVFLLTQVAAPSLVATAA
jgi:hypothetical protein